MNIRSISCPKPSCNGSGDVIFDDPVKHLYLCMKCGEIFSLDAWAEKLKEQLEETDEPLE